MIMRHDNASGTIGDGVGKNFARMNQTSSERADVILFNINDYIKCLRKNIDNVNIKKIFVFMELSTDNLPCSDKVSYFIKKGYTDEQTLNIIIYIKKYNIGIYFVY
jgi:hypothetical protein